MKIRYGIVSTASIVERFVRGVQESKDGEVVAISSRDYNKALAKAQALSIPKAYGSYQQLLNDSDVDVIYIPTPNMNHYQDAQQALLMHKHVVVEKPFTLTKQQAEDLFALAKKQNCFIMEAQKEVFLPITQKVKEIIDSKQLGDICYLNMSASFPNRFNYDHWMYSLACGGGALYGSNSYTVHYLLYLFDPSTITYQGVCSKAITKTDNCCQLQFVLDDKIVVGSVITMNVSTQNVALIYGELGYIEVENYWKARKLVIHYQDGRQEEVTCPCQWEFVYEVEHINQCINNQLLTSPILTKEKTIKTMEITEDIFNSWQ